MVEGRVQGVFHLQAAARTQTNARHVGPLDYRSYESKKDVIEK